MTGVQTCALPISSSVSVNANMLSMHFMYSGRLCFLERLRRFTEAGVLCRCFFRMFIGGAFLSSYISCMITPVFLASVRRRYLFFISLEPCIQDVCEGASESACRNLLLTVCCSPPPLLQGFYQITDWRSVPQAYTGRLRAVHSNPVKSL